MLLGGCDSGFFGGEDHDPPATEILRVDVEPNPVLVGDTARYRCVIKDSLDSGFRFFWILENVRGGASTSTNTFLWVAPTVPKTYRHAVQVTKPSDTGLEEVQKSFQVKLSQCFSAYPAGQPHGARSVEVDVIPEINAIRVRFRAP